MFDAENISRVRVRILVMFESTNISDVRVEY